MNFYKRLAVNNKKYLALSCAVATWMAMPVLVQHVQAADAVYVTASQVQEDLKTDSTTKTVITREELDRKGARNLAEALSGVQNVQMNVDDMGRQTVAIRGAEPRHTLFLVDGRRLAQGLSKFRGASDEVFRLETDSIDRVEVIRGAASAKYGADAMGGVINIITKIPDTMGVRTNLEYSRIATTGAPQLNNFVSFATGKVGPLKAEITYSKIKTQPFFYGDHQDSMQYHGKRFPMTAKAALDLGSAGELRFDYDRIEEKLEKETELTNQYKAKTTGYKNIYAHLVAQEEAKRTNRSWQWTKSTDTVDWKVRHYKSEMNNDTNFMVSQFIRDMDKNKNIVKVDKVIPNPYFDAFRTEQQGTEVSARILIQDTHLLTIGAEQRKEHGEGTRISVPGQEKNPIYRKYIWQTGHPDGFVHVDADAPVPEGYTAISSFATPKYINEATIKSHSFYVEDEWTIGDQWVVTPAVRYESNSKFGNRIIPKVGVTYMKTPKLRYKVNLGTGYSTPGIAELYHNWEMYEPSMNELPPFRAGWFFKGNPDLKPEKSVNFDISVEAERGKTKFKGTLFRNTYRDFMQIVYDGMMASPNLRGFTHYDSNTRYFNPYAYFNAYDSWEEYKAAIEAAPTVEEKMEIARDLDYVSGLEPVDDVYTYKNIARARMQGVELEVSHDFSKRFSASLGYTFLDARDLDTNERLEGRGNNMFNLTLNYNDQKKGFRAKFWGTYTMHYLDIRDREETGRIIKFGKEVKQKPAFTFDNPDGSPVYVFQNAQDAKIHANDVNSIQTYTKEKKAKEKNYGVWNILFEKDMNPNTTVYFGVNNLFGAEDEFLNLGGRVYRIGLRAKL